MENKQIDSEKMPIFTTLKIKGKDRRVRLFGECCVISRNGKKTILRPRKYLFIKDSGKKIRYTNNINDLHPKDKQQMKG